MSPVHAGRNPGGGNNSHENQDHGNNDHRDDGNSRGNDHCDNGNKNRRNRILIYNQSGHGSTTIINA